MESNERTEQITDRLKEVREYLGLSQQIVADLVGIPAAAISEIESGKQKVNMLELEKFSKLYKHPVSYFYGEENKDEESIVWLLTRTAKDLTDADREQVLRFAQFLKNINSEL